jgi:hypothetical protein
MKRRSAVVASLMLTLAACGASAPAAVTVAPEVSAPTTTVPTTQPTTTVALTTTVPAAPTTTETTPTSTTAVQPTVTTTVVAPPPSEASLRLSPRAEYFPEVPSPYEPMPTLKVTVVNNGSTAMSSVVVNPVGVYSVPSSTCGSLQPGQSCSAMIQFCPTAPGSYPATLTVSGVSSTGKRVHVSLALHGTAG